MSDGPRHALKLLAKWYFTVGWSERAVKMCAKYGFDQGEIRSMETKHGTE